MKPFESTHEAVRFFDLLVTSKKTETEIKTLLAAHAEAMRLWVNPETLGLTAAQAAKQYKRMKSLGRCIRSMVRPCYDGLGGKER